MAHYQNNFASGNQCYAFDGISSSSIEYYNQCPTEQQSSAHANMNPGIAGPGTHVEETGPVPGHSSNRGRKKQRKKQTLTTDDVLGEVLKIEQGEEILGNQEGGPMNEIGIIPGDVLYGSIMDGSSAENQTLINGNTLDQILSYKKMMLLQSPDVIEMLKKCQPSTNK